MVREYWVEHKYNLNRLFWHSRRGMLELDLLLIPFVKEAFTELSEKDKALYVVFLENEDQDIFSWLLKKGEPSDSEQLRMVNLILEHNNRD